MLTKERPEGQQSEKSQEPVKYVTAQQAATRAQVSLSTVRRAIKSGELVYRARRGNTKTYLLRLDEVDAWYSTRLPVVDLNDVQPLDDEEE